MILIMKKTICWLLFVALFSAGQIGCNSSEAKKINSFETGKDLYKKGDYIHARLELKNAIQIDPKFAQGYYHLGLVELSIFEYKNAIAYFNKAIELNPHLWEAQLELGQLYLAGEAIEKALEKAEFILNGNKENTQALQLKAEVLLQKKDLTAAETLLKELIRKGVDGEKIYLLLAATAIYADDFKKVKTVLSKGISNNPKSVKLLSLQASILMNLRQFSETETTLKQIINIEPTEMSHILRLAEFYWQTDHYKKMNEQIDVMVEKNPSNVNTRLQAAKFYQKKSDYQTAASILKKGLEIDKESMELHLAIGELYLEQNRMDEVQRILTTCQNLVSDEKSAFGIRAQILLAKTLVIQGNLNAAKVTVDNLLNLDPNNANAHYIKGKIFLLNRDSNNAIEKFKIVITQTPEFEPAHQSLAQAYSQKAEQEKALLTLKQAVEYLPFSKNLRQALAEIYISRKEYMPAEVQLRYLTQYWPMDPMSYNTLGDFFLATDQFVKAEKTFLKLVNLYKENAIGYLKLSKLYQKKGQPQKAAAILKRAKLKNRSDANQLLGGQIQLLVGRRKFAEALSICNERLSQNSKDEFILNQRGLIYTKQKNIAAARQDFEKAIDLTPCWPIPHANLARLYLSEGDVQKAISWFESALQFNVSEIDVYMDLAGIYEKHKNYPKVIQIYEKALVVHPNMWAAVNKLAFFLAEYSGTPKDLQRALTLIRRAQFYNHYDPYVEDTLAWIFYKKGHLKEARRTMEIVLTHHPDNPIFNYHMGTILEKSGMMSAARKKLSLALASKENFIERQDAQVLLDRLDIIN
jgi:tetratricopeptide (TPR) repeat protein